MYLPVAVGSLIFLFILGPIYNHHFLPPKMGLGRWRTPRSRRRIFFYQNDADTVYWRLSFLGFILVAIGIACYFINFLNIVFSSSPPEEGPSDYRPNLDRYSICRWELFGDQYGSGSSACRLSQ
jgi:hypothetical protein